MRLKSDTQRPPGSFQYRVPETGVLIPSGPTSLYGCLEQVKRHYAANKLTVPAGLQEKIEDFACHQAPPGWCTGDDRPRQMADGGGADLGTQIDVVIQGSKTLASWLVDGSVAPEQAQARAAVCMECPKHGDTSCPRCRSGLVAKLANFVSMALKRQPEVWEAPLKACSICGCALRLKVWCKLDTIRKHTPSGQLSRFPAKCWIVTEYDGSR